MARRTPVTILVCAAALLAGACGSGETAVSPKQQSPAGSASAQIIGGSMLVSAQQETSAAWDDWMGLFGYAQDRFRGSRLPAGGTISAFTGMASRVPPSNTWFELTLFCSNPAGGPSSCGGQGGQGATLTCTIEGNDYVDLPSAERDRVAPSCVDGAKPKSWSFAAGDWINVRFRTNVKPTAVFAHWTATFTPSP